MSNPSNPQNAAWNSARSALTARGNRRRRVSLLATSSFVATSILAGAGVLTAVMTPSVALA